MLKKKENDEWSEQPMASKSSWKKHLAGQRMKGKGDLTASEAKPKKNVCSRLEAHVHTGVT